MEETNQQMLLRLAREPRRTPTPAEKELWERLRDHRCGGLHFRRQEIIGPFRLDFYCRRVKLAIEVDGGIHQINSVQRRDVDRQQILEQDFGICFLRVTNEEIRQHLNEVIGTILALTQQLLTQNETTVD